MEAGAVALLLRRRREAVDFGLAHAFPVVRIAERVQSHVASGIAESRIISRASGIEALTQEVAGLGVTTEDMAAVARAQVARDIRRANAFAKNYAAQWAKKATGDTVAEAAKAADAGTLGSLNRTAVTESAEAFNHGRSVAAETIPDTRVTLLKVWDALLDACPICLLADGTIVGIKENFPQGTPGAVHPWCRCTWQALTFTEQGDDGLIEPKPPAKVLSLPTKP